MKQTAKSNLLNLSEVHGSFVCAEKKRRMSVERRKGKGRRRKREITGLVAIASRSRPLPFLYLLQPHRTLGFQGRERP